MIKKTKSTTCIASKRKCCKIEPPKLTIQLRNREIGKWKKGKQPNLTTFATHKRRRSKTDKSLKLTTQLRNRENGKWKKEKQPNLISTSHKRKHIKTDESPKLTIQLRNREIGKWKKENQPNLTTCTTHKRRRSKTDKSLKLTTQLRNRENGKWKKEKQPNLISTSCKRKRSKTDESPKLTIQLRNTEIGKWKKVKQPKLTTCTTHKRRRSKTDNSLKLTTQLRNREKGKWKKGKQPNLITSTTCKRRHSKTVESLKFTAQPMNKENGKSKVEKYFKKPNLRSTTVSKERGATDEPPLNKANEKLEKKKRPKNPNVKNSIDSKLKPLEVVVNKVENKAKNKKTKFERNPSFEKYGIVLPSYEKILEDQKKFEEHKNQVQILDALDDEILEKSFDLDLREEKKFSDEILDCKHLSADELNAAVEKHMEMLKKIMNGQENSDRHKRYHSKSKWKSYFTPKDLRCSTSVVVFSQEQKDQMMSLLTQKLDPEEKQTRYFFQVLLPELCLLIFMDCHNMSKTKATRYLNERPLDDSN